MARKQPVYKYLKIVEDNKYGNGSGSGSGSGYGYGNGNGSGYGYGEL